MLEEDGRFFVDDDTRSEVGGQRRVLDRFRCECDGSDLSIIDELLEDGFGEESLMVD